MSDEKILKAFEVWQARQERREHPEGSFDRAGRWYPDSIEEQYCCSKIRTPSRRFPYSLMKHCRSIEHVATLHGVPASELRKLAKEQAAEPRREGGDNYYKVVAIVHGHFFSIFDGETEYVFGKELRQTARQGHEGGYYVYATAEEALHADFPSTSELLWAPRALLRIRASGSYCRYPNGKLSFSRVTPLEIVKEL